MKLKGKVPGAPKPRYCVIEREDDQFVFRIDAVLDYTDFDKFCPEPTPPQILKPGGKVFGAPNDPSHLKALEAHGQYKTHWTILKALANTEELEWDEVKLDDPDTWHLYVDEFRSAGLTEGEIAYLVTQIYENLGIDEKKMTEARDRFLRSQEAADKS